MERRRRPYECTGDGIIDLWSHYENGHLVRRDLNAVGLEMLSQKDQPPPGRSQTDSPNQSSRQPRLTKLRFQETPDASGERMEAVSKGSYRTHNRPSLHKQLATSTELHELWDFSFVGPKSNRAEVTPLIGRYRGPSDASIDCNRKVSHRR